jgi:tetratricopeptide (TPR) repeat protein
MTLVQPRRSRRTAINNLSVILIAAAATGGCSRRAEQPPSHTVVAAPALSESEIRDRDIEFYAARVQGDPTGAANLARLASLYLQRSRETGDSRDALHAEDAARRSIHNRAAHNDAAEQVLSSALLSQHRFVEALRIAEKVRDRNPTSAPLRAAVAEIEMELGQYDSATAIFSKLGPQESNPSVAPRLARWAEIRGETDAARRFIRKAVAIASADKSLPREQVAWFWLRSGDIELRAGNLSGADSAYRAGLAAHPDDYRLLAGMSRLEGARHQWQNAVEYGERAIAVNLDPATLGLLSDAYAALGDSAKSGEYAHALDVAVRKQPGAYHRAWSLFLLDHDRRVAEVYEKTRKELETRKDIYGYDLLAWALHKQGRDHEASAAMKVALSQGTLDPQLLAHAAVIDRALASSRIRAGAGAAR